MYHLIIDTCVWVDLCSKFPELLDKIVSLVKQEKVRLILPSIVIEEWKRQKPKLLERQEQSVRGKLKNAKELSQYLDSKRADTFKEILDDFQEQKARVENAASERINHITQLFGHPTTIILETTNTAKIRAVDLALAKKAPFGSKNSMADALIILSAAEHIAKGDLPNCIFVSSNSHDFSSSSNLAEVHKDLKELFDSHQIRYFINIGQAINEVEAHLVSEESIQQVEETVTLDALYNALQSINEAMTLRMQAVSEAMALPAREIQAVSEAMALPAREIQAVSEAMALRMQAVSEAMALRMQAVSEAMALPAREAMQRVTKYNRELLEAIIAAVRPLGTTSASETQKDDATLPDDAQGDKPKKSDAT